ncbi:hypothetical protein DFJ77DRAFT_454582 [Powellomyces hirtus]|nr:hypothetical protein DFJ77DRAFT_454582 [Powellomyces hirtus]
MTKKQTKVYSTKMNNLSTTKLDYDARKRIAVFNFEADVMTERFISPAALFASNRVLEFVVPHFSALYNADMKTVMAAMPVLQYFEGMVYECDKRVERAQQDPSLGNPNEIVKKMVFQDCTGVLEHLHLLSPTVLSDFRALVNYIAEESALLKSSAVSDTDLTAAMQKRTGDIFLLHYFFSAYTGLGISEGALAAMKCVYSFWEYDEDAKTIEEDRKEGGFNSMLLLEQMHDGDQKRARVAFRERCVGTINELMSGKVYGRLSWTEKIKVLEIIFGYENVDNHPPPIPLPVLTLLPRRVARSKVLGHLKSSCKAFTVTA